MRIPFVAVRTRSAAETISLGTRIGGIVRPGEILLLVGELGTGKTTFVQGLATGLELEQRPRSPTFTIVRSYEGGRFPLVHVDLYRCANSHEVLTLGLEELLSPPAVAVVEWGEKAATVVGDNYLELDFSFEQSAGPDAASDDATDDVRTIGFLPFGRWRERMGDISETIRSWATPESA